MADLTILPTWAVNYLNENLTGHTHIVNALPIDEGKAKGGFLVNTSQGAVLLIKGRLGEPRHWFLPLPARHFSFICHQCMERIEFVDPDVPRTVYCTHCGCRYLLAMEEGKMALRRDHGSGSYQPEAKPKAEPVQEASTTFRPARVAKEPAKPAAKPAKASAYQHGDYTLYERATQKKGGGTTTFYFFAKNTPKSGKPCAMPDGYSVEVNERTKLPYLRRDDKEPEAEKFQCGAIREDGKQCTLTARAGKQYCHVHKDYNPVSRHEIEVRMDTKPRAKKAVDTLPGEGDRGVHANQCAAITAAGGQCSNRSRAGSKYCGLCT